MQREWSIIFIVYAFLKKADILHKHLNHFIEEIQKTNIKENNSYYLLINQIDDTKPKGETHDQTILYNYTTNGSKTQRTEVETFNTERLLQKPKEIERALKSISQHEKFNAKRIAVCTWDHGAAFGMFRISDTALVERGIKTVMKDSTDFLQIFTLAESYSTTIPRNQVYNRWWDDFMRQDSDIPAIESTLIQFMSQKGISYHNGVKPKLVFDMLYNEDLAAAIKNGLGRKVDIVLMANCYMQNLHTASALKDDAEILIAPQGDLEYPCYDYSSIIEKLEEDPCITKEALAKFIVEQSGTLFKAEHLDKLSLFATRLSNLKLVSDNLVVIASYFKRQMVQHEKLKGAIEVILQFCFPFETDRPYSMRDLANFLYQISIYDPKKEGYEFLKEAYITELIEALDILADNYIIAEQTGKKFTQYAKVGSVNYTNNILPRALALYLPEKEEITETLPKYKGIAFKSTLIKEAPEWGAFLKYLYNISP